MPSRLNQKTRRIWAILCLALKKFMRIDGTQWAGAFAFNAFFALFPLMILLVTIALSLVDPDRAGKEVIAYMESYIPIGGMLRHHIFKTIADVITTHGQMSAVAFLILVWVALQCFTTIIYATNRAWGTKVSNWWRLPLKSLMLLGITAGAMLLGMAAPVLMRLENSWFFRVSGFNSWVYALAINFVPLLVVFFGLSLFYKLAPHRPTRFAEVWAAALSATVLLQAAESLFMIYLQKFAALSGVYGAFGGMMALLLWIYISGCIFIYGACLCAAQAERRSA